MKGRRGPRFASIEALLAEVDALADAERGGRLVALGNWSLGQAVNHLAVWAEYAYTGAPLPAPWAMRVVMRVLKPLVLRRGMVAGVRIPGTPGGTLGADPTPTDAAIARLRAGLGRLSRETPTKPNVLFGPLAREEHVKLQLRHAELHLGFFRPA